MTGLRSIIEIARDESTGSLKDFTVLSAAVDPYRLDTPANHAVGRWFAEQMERLELFDRRLHLRGIHYAMLGNTKLPTGADYTNTRETWDWLLDNAAKAGRWLGYVPFGAITDARNEAPVIRISGPPKATTYVFAEPEITFPEIVDIEPEVGVSLVTQQPYRLALYGEKSSLSAVLKPIAEWFDADLYLPTGEISDTQMNMMAEAAAEDGRKLIVFTVADFDPAGWQMAVSIGRKLQALRDLRFPDLAFELHAVALTGAQARAFDLPSTPLKATELRADKWREAMGWEQTEIDSLATLRPDVLRHIVEDAIAPFYDYTLGSRAEATERDWRERAQAVVDKQLDHDQLGTIRRHAMTMLDGMREQITAMMAEARTATDDLDIDLPAIEPPKPEIDEAAQPKPLISSDWSWPEQTRALIARKGYTNGGAA